MSDQTYLYFMISNDRPNQTKIGISKNPQKRAKDVRKQYKLKHIEVWRTFKFPTRQVAYYWERRLLQFVKTREHRSAQMVDADARWQDVVLPGEWVYGTPSNVMWHVYEMTKRMKTTFKHGPSDFKQPYLILVFTFRSVRKKPVGKKWRRAIRDWGLGVCAKKAE
jgi:hypothetical protein